MTWTYECKGCEAEFKAELSYGDDVTCTECGAVNEVEYEESWNSDTGDESIYSNTTVIKSLE
jgi:rRNA maturation endonuclease Nob1